MARIAAPVSERPEWKPPKLDLEAVPARHKANLAAARQTRAVLLHAARAVATLQAGHAKALITRARDALATRASGKPETVPGEVKAAAETTFATARRSIDLGVAAQRRVAELAAARTRASLERLQALAA